MYTEINSIQMNQELPLSALQRTEEKGSAAEGAVSPGFFGDILKTAAEQVRETQLDVEDKQYLLASGQLQDAHSLPIAEAKAAVSVELMVTLRNKLLEGYNELMRMNL